MSDPKEAQAAPPAGEDEDTRAICGKPCPKSDCNGTCGARPENHTGPHTCWLCGKSWQ